jgi:hypothetical protein
VKLSDALITASLTLAGGVLLMVVTQIFTRFIADPLIEFRRLIGEVAYTLIVEDKWLCNPNVTAALPEFQHAKDECRKLASRLLSLSEAVPLYGFFVDLGMIPERSKVNEAARALIGLSNTQPRQVGDISPMLTLQKQHATISKCLRIRVD